MRALLIAAALIVTCLCATAAQDTVTLIGVRAERTDSGATIELITSGPADFEINRFTAGDWVSIWSHSLDLNGADEIPLELDRPELAGLLAGASLVEERHRATVRIYLGPEADQRGVFIMRDGDTTKVYLPAKDEPLDAVSPEPEPATAQEPVTVQPTNSEPGPPTAPLAQEPVVVQPVVPAGRMNYAVEDEPVTPVADTPLTVIEANSNVAVDPPTEIIEPQAPVELASGAPSNGAGSFYVPRQEETPAADSGHSPLGLDALQRTRAKPSQLDTSSAVAATMNYQMKLDGESYQMMPVDRPGNGSGDGADEAGPPPSLEDMLKAATEMATQMLGGTTPAAEQTSVSIPRASDISTTGFMASPSQTAELSLGNAGAPAFGKEALAAIRIDLFEIVNSPLDQAITLLIAPTDFNIIVDSSVGTNFVSLSFKDSSTDLKSALDMITRAYGLAYTVQANTIIVADKEQLEGGLIEFETRLFVLSYADPKSVKDMLESTGLVTESQVEIYAGEAAYGAVNDSTVLSTESGSEGTDVKPIETNLSSTPRNALLVKAVPEQMVKLAAIIAELDRRPRMIELEVRVCEASETALRNLGLELNNNSATATATNTIWTEQLNENEAIEAFTSGSYHRSPMQFIMQLNTQIQEGTVEVLAQPTLPTVEGKQAIFFAGERIPYIAKVSYTQTGTQIEVDFLNVGITLNFKPRLDADGKLTIDVNPIVSSLLEFRMIGDIVEAPRTSSRQLATTVHVESGEPFVLAGLISETERETVTKIPLLGDLPLLGKLFRSTNHKGERTEIIIVVVPKVYE